MAAYGEIVRVMIEIGVKRGLQHRTEFLLEGGLSIVTIAAQLIPIAVLFGQRTTVAGWSHGEMLVLLGWFLIVNGIIQGAITSSFSQSINGIRTGQFDYVLLKPVDALIMSSLANLRPWKLIDVVAGFVLAGVGFAELGHLPGVANALLAAGLAGAALVTVYALYVFAVAASFALVRVENLMHVLSGLLDFGRWPIQVFEGAWRIAFTVVLPLAIITSYPVMALLGTISWRETAIALLVACGFAAAARLSWNVAIARYGSASS